MCGWKVTISWNTWLKLIVDSNVNFIKILIHTKHRPYKYTSSTLKVLTHDQVLVLFRIQSLTTYVPLYLAWRTWRKTKIYRPRVSTKYPSIKMAKTSITFPHTFYKFPWLQVWINKLIEPTSQTCHLNRF